MRVGGWVCSQTKHVAGHRQTDGHTRGAFFAILPPNEMGSVSARYVNSSHFLKEYVYITTCTAKKRRMCVYCVTRFALISRAKAGHTDVNRHARTHAHTHTDRATHTHGGKARQP